VTKTFSVQRLIRAFGYSWQGLRAVWASEAAFRLEIITAIPMTALALWLPVTPGERAVLLLTLFIILLAEILNSAIEVLVDRISPEQHPLSGKAKDIGSAAVLMALVGAALVWATILWPILCY
jgi:diacylglycerol kinase (ATP)